jgi:hypothetical protein
MPSIDDQNLTGAFGSGSLTNSGGSVNYDAPSNQISFDNQISGDSYDWSTWNGFNDLVGGTQVQTLNNIANDFGQIPAMTSGSVNDAPKKADEGFFKGGLDILKDFFGDKEGKRMLGMGVLMGLSGIENRKYKDAQLKANQQIGNAAESRELRAAENAKSAGQAFGLIGQAQTSFKPKPIIPLTQRGG